MRESVSEVGPFYEMRHSRFQKLGLRVFLDRNTSQIGTIDAECGNLITCETGSCVSALISLTKLDDRQNRLRDVAEPDKLAKVCRCAVIVMTARALSAALSRRLPPPIVKPQLRLVPTARPGPFVSKAVGSA